MNFSSVAMHDHNNQDKHRQGLESVINKEIETDISIPSQISQFYTSAFAGSLVAIAEIGHNQQVMNPIYISGTIGLASGFLGKWSSNYNGQSRAVKGLASASGYLMGYVFTNFCYQSMTK